MSKEEKVTIRLSPDQTTALDSLVADGQFRNRSDALRSALDRLVLGEEDRENILPLELPRNILTALDFLVSIGYYESRERAARELVRDAFFNLDMTSIKQQYEAMEEIDIEASASRLLDDQFGGILRK